MKPFFLDDEMFIGREWEDPRDLAVGGRHPNTPLNKNVNSTVNEPLDYSTFLGHACQINLFSETVYQAVPEVSWLFCRGQALHREQVLPPKPLQNHHPALNRQS
jgi:hypothetical protein